MLYRKGDKGAEVFIIKTALFALGYLTKAPTHNRFGADTDKAVRKYQKAKGLVVDGVVGPLTASVLKTEWAAFQASDGKDAVKSDLYVKRERMLDYIESAVGDLYVWGAQGQEATVVFIDKRAAAKPEYVTPARAARFKRYASDHPTKANGEPLRCFDCSGLFWAAENETGLLPADDSTAKGLDGSYCIPVLKEELRPLDLVFSGSPISHVGVVGREGKIYATNAAVSHGKSWNGFKVVEGRSVRKYSDESRVAEAAAAHGYKDVYRQSLIPMTEMQKLMGKAKFEEILGGLICKPPGKPTLVPLSDKRPAINVSNAINEFNEITED